MTRERLTLYDTTLRDGQQTQGVQFSTAEKHGSRRRWTIWGSTTSRAAGPGRTRPTASSSPPPQTRATLTAFGMTKRAGRSAANDDVLAAVLNAGTPAVCLVGKTHDFHVTTALGITLDENLENIRASVAHAWRRGARRCSMPSISSTATRPTPTMRWPACMPR
jgi:2-isopropylmalate synthase